MFLGTQITTRATARLAAIGCLAVGLTCGLLATSAHSQPVVVKTVSELSGGSRLVSRPTGKDVAVKIVNNAGMPVDFFSVDGSGRASASPVGSWAKSQEWNGKLTVGTVWKFRLKPAGFGANTDFRFTVLDTPSQVVYFGTPPRARTGNTPPGSGNAPPGGRKLHSASVSSSYDGSFAVTINGETVKVGKASGSLAQGRNSYSPITITYHDGYQTQTIANASGMYTLGVANGRWVLKPPANTGNRPPVVGNGGNTPPGPSNSNAAVTLSKVEKELLDLVNAERAKVSLPALKINSKLQASARAHSANMARQNHMNHVLDGKNAPTRISGAGYRWSAWGENVNMGPSARSAMYGGTDQATRTTYGGWMFSKDGHKEAILSATFKEIGLAVVKGSRENYWTQVFGTPLSGRVEDPRISVAGSTTVFKPVVPNQPTTGGKPGKPTITGTNGSASAGTASIAWSAVSGAARYEVWAYNKSLGRPLFDQANAKFSQVGSLSFRLTGVSAGQTVQVFVRGVNSAGQTGEWAVAEFPAN